MCIFAQPVRAVKNTKILVSPLGADMQLTVYQNSVDLPDASSLQSRKKVAKEIQGILSQHSPSKLKNVSSLLDKYRGREYILLNKIKQKYKSTVTKDESPQNAAPPLPPSIKNAMVLPVPSGKPVILLDFSKHGAPFIALNACFPTLDLRNKSRARHASLSSSMKALQVHDVGNYKVSVAPNLKDLRRVDTSVFTLAPDIDKLLADKYGGNFSFVVCRMKNKSIKNDSIGYVSADFGKGKLFVPTMHGHDGHAAAEPDWDHYIYSLGCVRLGHGACDGSGSSPADDLARFQLQVNASTTPKSKRRRNTGPRVIHGHPTQFPRAMELLNAVLKEAKVAVDSVTGEQVAVQGVQLPEFGMESLRRLRVQSGPNKDFVFAKAAATASAASASTEVTTAEASAASASTEVTTAEASAASASTEVTTAEASAASASTEVTTAEASAASASTEVTTAEASAASASTEVTTATE